MGAKTHGWKEVGRDAGWAAANVVEQGKKVVGKGCLNVKKDAQRIVRAASHRGYLPHYPRSIGYDVTARAADITGEIGPDSNKLQGGLGRILEFGTVNNAPIPHIIPSLDAELPRFEQFVAELGEKLIFGKPGPDGPVTDPGN